MKPILARVIDNKRAIEGKTLVAVVERRVWDAKYKCFSKTKTKLNVHTQVAVPLGSTIIVRPIRRISGTKSHQLINVA